MGKFLYHSGAIIFWITATIAVPVFILSSMADCALTEYESSISPDKQKQAIVFIKNCGATTNWETQIVVREIKDIDNQDILIRLDGHPENTDYNLMWQADNSLTISDFKFEDLLDFHSRNTVGDVTKTVIHP
ncbi:hypothetical protein I6F53_19355 [Pseudoalteromonas sp. SWN29]|uniref:hypothetical protein n=1 Tax=Pseudoalteromonas sp. SWN29 TaxID=2792064 RepID=UPI0018CF4826|nr:hypothetical protein [Pseudoalteromonas sp. SWN29]MBH0029115.1 hypothetical protein [Pseudoalteromonas sp. SWN29]